jgi:SAM-dependent methyltransferase
MSVWLPTFACPECRAVARATNGNGNGCSGFVCPRCGTAFETSGGIYRFLTRDRAAAAAPFECQYRHVRQREGFRSTSPDYYRRLPSVEPGDSHATVWRIRQESFELFRRHALPDGDAHQVRLLDLGAGNGWLSHRLAALGHRVVAVDRLDDDADGLGACRHYPVPFAVLQADFNALPLAPAQFDIVVFDGSLHYAAVPEDTLAEAGRMLEKGGALVVMDSPMFTTDRDGEAMVAGQLRQIAIDHEVLWPLQPGRGFLTFAALENAGRRLGLHGVFYRSRGPISWRLGRQMARFRLRRAPAAFGVWVAR